MVEVVVRDEVSGKPLWIDVDEPSREELDSLAQTYGLASTAVEDCLLPGHLPKHEKIGDATFMIIRAYDEEAEPSADTVPWMTRKIALFLGNRFLLTSHLSPDGDAIGSELGLARVLRKLGKGAVVWNRDATPPLYAPLPGSGTTIAWLVTM